jgi:hypothetical protein
LEPQTTLCACHWLSIELKPAYILFLQAASDVYSPVSGEVVEVNQTLADSPATVGGRSDA